MQFSAFLEPCRVIKGPWATAPGSPWGLFYVSNKSYELKIIADDGATTGWEHVSVSLPSRTPNWDEMCFVKSLFWSDEETVVQFHPRASEYVNSHPHCLHLWRRVGVNAELPPRVLV